VDNRKPVYLLSGGRGGDDRTFRPLVQAIFGETGKPEPVIAYVGVASDDNWVFYQFISRMIQQAGKCRITRVLLTSKKADVRKAQELLNTADAVFMSGGDVERGMEVLQEKGLETFFQSLYQQGKQFFGASAGSILMAREWVRWRDPEDDSTAELFPCLNFSPVICDTHGEADAWEELQAAIKLKGEGEMGYGIITGACLKVYPDGRLEAYGGAVSRYICRGQNVEKLSDLANLPLTNGS
jgi:peptidase E